MQRQAPTTSHHWFSVGSYLNSASYNLQGSSNSHQFFAGTNLQEAPTSASYSWHLSSYNLIWKHQLPHSFIRKHLLIYLDISSVMFLLFYCPSVLIYALYHLCIFSDSLSAPPSSLPRCFISAFSNLSMHINVILFIEFIIWLFLSHREFKMKSHDSLNIQLIQRNIAICIHFSFTMEFCFPTRDLPMHHKQYKIA